MLLKEDKEFQFIMVFFPIWHKWAQNQTGSQQEIPISALIQQVIFNNFNILPVHPLVDPLQSILYGLSFFNATSFFTLLYSSATVVKYSFVADLFSVSLC